MKLQAALFIFGLYFSLTPLEAKIIVSNDKVEFIESVEETHAQTKRDSSSPQFLSFKKMERSLPYEKACSGPPYHLNEDKLRSYSSLNNFIELTQKTDFKVDNKKEYVVVFTTSCQKPCNAAEIEWTCKLNASALDENGYVLADMEGNFENVFLHHKEPYIFLLRSTVGGMEQYAEVYDLQGSLIKTIQNFEVSFLDEPLKRH